MNATAFLIPLFLLVVLVTITPSVKATNIAETSTPAQTSGLNSGESAAYNASFDQGYQNFTDPGFIAGYQNLTDQFYVGVIMPTPDSGQSSASDSCFSQGFENMTRLWW